MDDSPEWPSQPQLEPYDLSDTARLLRGLASVSRILLTVDRLDNAINQALAFLGQATQSDRVYICEICEASSPGNGQAPLLRQRWQWGSDDPALGLSNGISPQLPSQGLACPEGFPRWLEVMVSGRTIHGPVANFPAQERRQLESLGICSILVLPIVIQDTFWGLVGFDDCQRDRQWTLTDISILGAIASSLGGAIARDASAQRLQALNQSLQDELEQQTQALAQVTRAKRKLLSSMDQQLGQPLSGMVGQAQLLNRSLQLGPAEQQGLATIYQCGTQALMLLSEMLDLTRLEVGELALQPSSVHLPSFLQGIVELCRWPAEQRGLLFVYRPTPQLPMAVIVDGLRLRQVLVQLLEYAAQTTDAGQITFAVEVLNHRFSPLPRSDRLRFSVVNTAQELSPSERDRLLQYLNQSVQSLCRDWSDRPDWLEDRNLGLFISQKIVSLMGGEIEIEVLPGEGNRFAFEIELPLADQWHRQALQATQVAGYEGERRRILIVDDRWENRSVLLGLLEPLGFEVVEAVNGAEGLALLESSRPDLIITDLVMPVLDGFGMMRQIRAQDQWQGLPILVSSASVDLQEQRRSLSEGASDLVTKPIQVAELLSLLAKHLQLTWRSASGEVS